MGWQSDAAAAARRVGIDPDLYIALVRKESGGRQGAVSPAGAIGRAQLMPGTAQGLGVDPRDPQQNLYGGALYLSQQLKRFGGDPRKALAAYNAGPGAVQKYGGIPPFAETQNYVKTIMAALGGGGGSRPDPSGAPVSRERPQAPAAGALQAAALGGGALGPAQSVAGTIASLMQKPAAPAWSSSSLQAPGFASGPAFAGRTVQGGGGPAPRQDVGALIDATRTPGQEIASTLAQASPIVADASKPRSAPGSAPSTGTGGAQAALGWAQSKIGFKEATGNNDGGLAGYLNQRFGFRNAAWCAMFTSAAVTKGGAPASARTAAVRDVRTMAENGGGGYHQGFIPAQKAKAGDLILFGNDHIGMVQRVKNGKVFYVGGNQSNGVTEASVPVGRGDIVRPKYGARNR